MKLSKRTCGVFLLGCNFLLAACTTPYKVPILASRPPEQTTFPGIEKLLSDSPGRQLDVLFVHGMGTRSDKDMRSAIQQLSELLDGPAEPTIDKIEVPGSKALVYRADFELPARKGTIRARAILWSPVVALLKSQLCYDQTKKSAMCLEQDSKSPPYPYDRASLNQEVKDGLLNDRLADVIIYQGKSRDAINEQVQAAIREAIAPGGPRTSKQEILRAIASQTQHLVFVTDSLGSKITFDAVYKMVGKRQDDEKAAGVSILNRIAQIFMRANQIPMLALADQTLDGKPARVTDNKAYPADPLDASLRLRSNGVTPIKVVAFTDPNDLLSYIHETYTPPEKAPSEKPQYSVVDVIVSNAETYFGFLENPIAAHTDYDNTGCVKQLIREGTNAINCWRRKRDGTSK